MPEIGVRELKARASEIVRAVRDQRMRYTVTYRGRPVGVLMPLSEIPETNGQTEPDPWEELIRLGKEIDQGWQSSQTSTELLSELRR